MVYVMRVRKKDRNKLVSENLLGLREDWFGEGFCIDGRIFVLCVVWVYRGVVFLIVGGSVELVYF